MLGGIAVEKKIYTRETAQICVGLHIREVKSLRESSNARHYIFYSVKYFFLVHDYALLLTINTLILIAKLVRIFNIAKHPPGLCCELVPRMIVKALI